ncbi:MAG: type II toxin-antitoxin system HicA family toxin [Anaerolineae bacterium]
MPPKHIWTSQEVKRALESLGYLPLPKRGKGSHALYARNLICAGGEPVNITVSVPYHLGQGTVRTIARRVGLSHQQPLDALCYYEVLAASLPRDNFLPPFLRKK